MYSVTSKLGLWWTLFSSHFFSPGWLKKNSLGVFSLLPTPENGSRLRPFSLRDLALSKILDEISPL